MKKIILLLLGVLSSQSTLSMERVIRQTSDVESIQKMREKLLQKVEENSPNTYPIKGLLSKGATENEYNQTALMQAADEGREDFCKLLLKQGAPVNKKDTFGRTALMFAAKKGHGDICSLLLAQGADVNAATKYTNLMALVFAAEKGHEDVCRLLLDHGAHLDAETMCDDTALMYAAKEGHINICSLLLDHGACVNAQDYDGWTALMYAVEHGHEDICRLLLDHEAYVDVTSNHGLTALMLAADNGQTGICHILLDHGARVDTKYEDGWTALTYAADNGYEDICSLLLEQGLILPQEDPEKVTKFRKESITMFTLFNQFPRIPRDIRYTILFAGWKKEIQILIKQFVRTGWAHLIPTYFQGLKNKIIDDSAQETLTKLKKMMEEALPYAKNDEMRGLLNPETLDLEKRQNNLIRFSQRRKELDKKEK